MTGRMFVAVIAAVLALASHARRFDLDTVNRTVNQVQRTVNQFEDAAAQAGRSSSPGGAYAPRARQPSTRYASSSQTYAPETYAESSESDEEQTSEPRGASKPGFRERMGPIAACLNDVIEWIERNLVKPAKDWTETLDHDKRVLFMILFGAAFLVPVLIVIVVARRSEDSLKALKGSAGCAALAGVAFTIWGGFEIGGSFGEWLALPIMLFMALSAVIAVFGGFLCGRSVIFKLLAPFMMLEMSLAMFILAMLVTSAFIMIAIIVIVLSVIAGAADSNKVYKCPECGRTFNYRPSSCPCGAQFE